MVPMEAGAEQSAKAPARPHLALLIKDGSWVAIPEGATIAVITNPGRIDGVLPLIVTRVSLKSIWLRCACGKKDCSRTYVWQMRGAGYHPTFQETHPVGQSPLEK